MGRIRQPPVLFKFTHCILVQKICVRYWKVGRRGKKLDSGMFTAITQDPAGERSHQIGYTKDCSHPQRRGLGSWAAALTRHLRDPSRLDVGVFGRRWLN